ncbi:19641_t:CDS:2, partial [Funneliformis geosporum]
KIVATEGVNIYSNDIAVILNTYGVKAARTAILKEVSGVLLYNGIDTFEGKYKPFNRIGLDTSISPLLKMSFETTFHGDTDLLDSLLARLVLGKVIQGGTGSFDVR